MSNSFNISVAPEIAALEVKVDTIDTIVDLIRSADIPLLDGKLDTVDTIVDLIRSADIPLLDGKLDTTITDIATVDTVVDAIKVKTDATPQHVRGRWFSAMLDGTHGTFTDVVNVSGRGKLMMVAFKLFDAGDTGEIKIVLDGTAFTTLSLTGDAGIKVIIPSGEQISAAGVWLVAKSQPDLVNSLFNYEYQSSLLVQTRRSAGAANKTGCRVHYILDQF